MSAYLDPACAVLFACATLFVLTLPWLLALSCRRTPRRALPGLSAGETARLRARL